MKERKDEDKKKTNKVKLSARCLPLGALNVELLRGRKVEVQVHSQGNSWVDV